MQRELLVDIPKCCQLDCELLMSFSAPSFPVEGRLLLDIKSLLFTFFLGSSSGDASVLASSTFVEAQAKGDAVFVGLKKTDRVGKTSASPTENRTAVFTLSLKPAAGEAGISEIEIRTLAGLPEFGVPHEPDPESAFSVLQRPRPLRKS